MARRRRLKTLTLPEPSRDLISELPLEVKDRILECLPTREAARTALLSRHWNDVWLQHGRLVFDWEFLQSLQQCEDDEGRNLVKIMNDILFFRAGPIKKFTLQILCDEPKPQQSKFDRWCLFLSRNGVEELNLSIESYNESYKLPFCLLYCKTIKQLIVQELSIDLPVNDCGIFSNVTSLAFLYVNFKRSDNGIASRISIPKLEKLAFELCCGINKFEISPPKLEILSVINCMGNVVESRWLAPHLKGIKTLWLCGSSLECMDVSMFPSAMNLQVLKLYNILVSCGKQLSVAMQLLKACPNLCELQIMADEFSQKDNVEEATSRLLEDPDGCFVIQEMKMLNTIKIEAFSDSALEMLFIKMLLSKSPALERVVIVKSDYTGSSEAYAARAIMMCLCITTGWIPMVLGLFKLGESPPPQVQFGCLEMLDWRICNYAPSMKMKGGFTWCLLWMICRGGGDELKRLIWLVY
ncbi:F-box/FBD/LRR-repeat protein At1g13570-like isoform X2 [Ipomoea triloba]|uniref:F-box/FBD/LRR-repeat protein At1g13570-like isoform X2 n=1 Tax=Ipomoea triloba TaxID=35885 RepID=UPI00125E234A|nr:F-box/FBD/LRR-repeat protein At1g13570-like isoform X2 [Ipomoea triloba]